MMTELDRQAKILLKALDSPEEGQSVIPSKVLNNHIAILGKTGSGKTYTAKGIAESMLRLNQRVCILDPTGVWWGLRSDVTGKKPAFSIFVLGGKHGDLPLDSRSGTAIAEIVGKTHTSAIIDTRKFTIGERTRFYADFAETLLQVNEGPLHVIIDEAHLMMPQGRVSDPQSAKMLNAGNNLVSLGRGVGLRIVLITQRPAKLHKDSLTQAETLIALRLIAPQDRNAVEDWIGEWADPKQGKELLSSLASLPTGTGWIWAPEIPLLELRNFPRISTYDSSKAPDGATRNVVLAPIDLPAIQERLEVVAKEVLENDPKKLRMRIAELERKAGEARVVEKPVLTPESLDRLQKALEEARTIVKEAS
jgi:DNA helicase HerA-like ATPase